MDERRQDTARQAALDYHEFPRPGKLEIRATKPLANGRDLSRAYSPGVAEACLEIKADAATAAVDRYLDTLNEPDPTTRRALIAQAWAADGGITDPPVAGQGHDGIADVGDTLHAVYAGHSFRRTSAVDTHTVTPMTSSAAGSSRATRRR